MKTPLLLVLALPARADIQVIFANHLSAYGINAPVNWVGHVYGTSAPLAEGLAYGQWFRAQLYASVGGQEYTAVGEPVSFRTRWPIGTVEPHIVVIPAPGTGGTAVVRMVAWCRWWGETYEEVLALGFGGIGVSNPVTITGDALPIMPPPALVGLAPFQINGPLWPINFQPPAPAVFLPVVAGDGRLGYRFTGLRSAWELTIETSTNLMHWLPYQRPWLPRGQGEFTFEVTADGPAQFFRGWQH